MVGGRPIRSRLKRRSSVTRSASGEGVKPSSSKRERMNRSIGVLTQAVFLTSGGAGRSGFTNAQCFLIADCGLPFALVAAEDGGAHFGAPAINATKTITTAEESFLFFIPQPRSWV